MSFVTVGKSAVSVTVISAVEMILRATCGPRVFGCRSIKRGINQHPSSLSRKITERAGHEYKNYARVSCLVEQWRGDQTSAFITPVLTVCRGVLYLVLYKNGHLWPGYSTKCSSWYSHRILTSVREPIRVWEENKLHQVSLAFVR